MAKWNQNEVSYYKLQSVEEGKKGKEQPFRIKKFDEDLNLVSDYAMNYIPTADGGYHDCQCPASKFDCRHKSIMREIVDRDMIDAEEFFSFKSRAFHKAEDL